MHEKVECFMTILSSIDKLFFTISISYYFIIFPWIPLIYHIKGPERTISYKVWETLKRINESNKEDENTKVMLDYWMEKCFCSLFNCPAINTYVSLDDDICQSQGFLISAVCGFSVHHLLAIPILLSDERICCNFNC